MRIAILQRDAAQRGLIERTLAQCGHACMPFSDGIALAKALAASTVDMLVLDWQGSRLSGTELLKTVRAVNGNQIPVLFASEDDSDESVVRAFSVGADDYVSLPVCPSVFRARVNALLRRAFPERHDNTVLEAGPYHFDMAHQPQTLVTSGLFNICSKYVQNSFGVTCGGRCTRSDVVDPERYAVFFQNGHSRRAKVGWFAAVVLSAAQKSARRINLSMS